MAEQFHCPACGAPLDIPPDAGKTLRCPYCAGSVIVPEELRTQTTPPTVIRLDLSANAEPGQAAAVQNSARKGLVTAFLLLALLGAGGALIAMLTFQSAAKSTAQIVSDIALEVDSPTAAPAATPTPALAELVRRIGDAGSGAGKMTDARAVAQDGQGNFYAADYNPGRVQIFNAQGEFVSQWLPLDPEAALHGIAALKDGRIAIAANSAVEIYAADSGAPLAQWRDGDKFGYSSVVALADGNLLATRTTASDNDVLIFSPEGAVVRRIEAAFTSQTGQSEMEMSAALDLSGNIYLLGSFSRLILKYDRDGKFITRIGGEGDQPGQFSSLPDSIAADSSGQVYVANGREIMIFDPAGAYLGSFEIDGVASGMQVNAKDELLIAARTGILVYRINR